MKIRQGRLSGALGNEVHVDSKYGAVVRSRPRIKVQATSGRLQARGNLARVAQAWRTCTEEQFAAWQVAAYWEGRLARKGRRVPLSGYALFCKINCALLAAGLPIVMDPPRREGFKRNPVAGLEIRNGSGGITLRLRLSVRPAQYTFVLGAPPCSAGRSVRSDYSIIGMLPSPVGGWSDITGLYVAKYGVPVAGRRVFIRTRQLVGGWEDEFKETNAVVPRE